MGGGGGGREIGASPAAVASGFCWVIANEGLFFARKLRKNTSESCLIYDLAQALELAFECRFASLFIYALREIKPHAPRNISSSEMYVSLVRRLADARHCQSVFFPTVPGLWKALNPRQTREAAALNPEIPNPKIATTDVEQTIGAAVPSVA